MANVKISQLTEQTTAADNDVVAGVSAASAGTVKTKLSTIATYLAGKSETLTNKTLTSPVINTGVSGTAIDTDGTLAANSDTKLASQKAVKTYSDNISYGMARQAIMNGNFDIWQRGTSASIVDAGSGFVVYVADRWRDLLVKDGGTQPTLTRSRQQFTSGELANSIYYTRLTTSGAGSNFGVNSIGLMEMAIENGPSKLAGTNKKVTISFWARSSITNKRLCVSLVQHYGTGGSPSANEYILGTPITLTSTWTKYAVTFTTNTLVGKTFGTNNDDAFQPRFNYMWGTTVGNSQVSAGVTAETFVGAGNIDIAQVQLCAGDVALPFQPKSYEEELRACQRYYERPTTEGVAFPSDTATALYRAQNYSTTTQSVFIPVYFKVTKRIVPNGTGKVRYDINDGTALTGDMTNPTANGFWFGSGIYVPAGQFLDLHDWEASAEL